MSVHTLAQRLDSLPTERDPRWESVAARDASADGTFYYSVATTGVYCLPSCHARLARPGNVRFHTRRAEAEAAGFRPCKRCKPDLRDTMRPRTTESIHFSIAPSSIGDVLVAHGANGVIALMLGDPREMRDDLARRFPAATLIEDSARLQPIVEKVIALVESPSRGFDVPLDVRGTDFQRSVWDALRRIPAGSTATYTEVARSIGMPRGARAVAQACAANALAIIIPCHRVIRGDGTLSGYRWGVERKRALLEKEAAS